jgi:hypothetical protein
MRVPHELHTDLKILRGLRDYFEVNYEKSKHWGEKANDCLFTYGWFEHGVAITMQFPMIFPSRFWAHMHDDSYRAKLLLSQLPLHKKRKGGF